MSPLRLLVKSYADHSITREEYVHIRTLLLDKLESSGHIKENDLENYLNLKNVKTKNEASVNYGYTDIVIFILGILAAATLAYILFV